MKAAMVIIIVVLALIVLVAIVSFIINASPAKKKRPLSLFELKLMDQSLRLNKFYFSSSPLRLEKKIADFIESDEYYESEFRNQIQFGTIDPITAVRHYGTILLFEKKTCDILEKSTLSSLQKKTILSELNEYYSTIEDIVRRLINCVEVVEICKKCKSSLNLYTDNIHTFKGDERADMCKASFALLVKIAYNLQNEITHDEIYKGANMLLNSNLALSFGPNYINSSESHLAVVTFDGINLEYIVKAGVVYTYTQVGITQPYFETQTHSKKEIENLLKSSRSVMIRDYFRGTYF